MSPEQQPSAASMSPTATSSFVYPIKSLLSGKICRSISNNGAGLLTLSRSRSEGSFRNVLNNGSAGGSTDNLYVSSLSTSESHNPQTPAVGWNAQAAEPHNERPPDFPRPRSFSESRDNIPSLNFRHYPAEDIVTPFAARTFATANPTTDISRLASPPTLTMESLSHGLNQSAHIDHQVHNEHILPPKIIADLDGVASSTGISSEPYPECTTPPNIEPFNLSQYGLVHLPPMLRGFNASPISYDSASSAHHSSSTHITQTSFDRGSPQVSGRQSQWVKGGPRLEGVHGEYVALACRRQDINCSSPYAATSTVPDTSLRHSSSSPSATIDSTSIITSARSSAPGTETLDDDAFWSEDSAIGSRLPTLFKAEQVSDAASVTSALSSQCQTQTTFRFTHEEDENGNHIIIGREGTLYKCEDEPIRTPGAVQGYGILVVVEETEDALVVRQVSENSAELLGLPPKYLFSLECFTDTLPESQAEILWDNIQLLDESCSTNDTEDVAPQVFLLSGFGAPGGDPESPDAHRRRYWTCWCAIHIPQRPSKSSKPLIIMEFEFERDVLNPLYPPADVHVPSGFTSPLDSSASTSSERTMFSTSSEGSTSASASSMTGDPSMIRSSRPPDLADGEDGGGDLAVEDIIESTTRYSKPIPALERLRLLSQSQGKLRGETNRSRRQGRRGHGSAPAAASGAGMMDVFAIVSQINQQLGDASDLESFLKVVVGVIKDLTQFHRVMIYQFDEAWNGLVVAELVDWAYIKELYRGLHFPAADIPAQARALYVVNKVRLLYDRGQTTARIVVRSQEDLAEPLDMTHCYLRAMSPIHIKYLANMGVRASMSISIVAFGALWGLVVCHSFGSSGMRVSFPVRQMLRLLSHSICRNIERLSYAQRLHTRKLINTLSSETHPTGHIVSNADDLLTLFDADYGVLVVGDAAKILGPNQHGQEILIVAEYLRLKQFDAIHASQAVVNDFPDLNLSTGLETIAGLLYVPLSSGGRDFIAFLRKGQIHAIRWAGKPKDSAKTNLEPRKSFKRWSETVAGRCRAWTDEQLETANVLALVYGKFIEVWRQKQEALHATKLTNLLLSNASHEVRTPLNHIINYLELALNGPLDRETRENLRRSHAASKSLLFTINDLLDLTRTETGGETSFNETFNLINAIKQATCLYRKEAERKGLDFTVDVSNSPTFVVGDAKKVMTVVQNLIANAVKFTSNGSIHVVCAQFDEPEGLRSSNQAAVEILVSDTGCGIPPEKLECLFREFEQVESTQPKPCSNEGLGLGLAVVARIVEQLRGQLRVDSKVEEGSRFSFLVPVSLVGEADPISSPHSSRSSLRSTNARSRDGSLSSGKGSELDSLVEAISTDHMRSLSVSRSPKAVRSPPTLSPSASSSGKFEVADSRIPVRPIKVDATLMDSPLSPPDKPHPHESLPNLNLLIYNVPSAQKPHRTLEQLRVLVVEDNDINRTILSKRLRLDGHVVVDATNGREGVDKVDADPEFDLVLMDIQMPIMDGFEATESIRHLEKSFSALDERSLRISHRLNRRLPIFAVSASLKEHQREELANRGLDGWILKPIDFKRLRILLKGLTEPSQRVSDTYRPGCDWEAGGWLSHPMYFKTPSVSED